MLHLKKEIFSIYLRGGWPCGWIGDWPKGRQLVYREGAHQHFDEYTDGGVQRGDAEGKHHLSDHPSVAMERLPGHELRWS